MSRSVGPFISSLQLCRCQHFGIATTSRPPKVNKKVPYLKSRGSSVVQTLSPKPPTSAVMTKIRASRDLMPVAQNFDYLLVLDFEATCTENEKILPYQEIIEFPVAKLDVKSWKISSYFHQYVRPTVNPILTSFCTHLTGIIQEMVDNQPTIDEALVSFDEWMRKEGVLDSKFAFVTCGDWDLGVMLPSESENKRIQIQSYFNNWINVKKSYCEHSGSFARGLRDLLRIYNLQHAVSFQVCSDLR